jgi:parallel beta-helix repeat protein
MTSRVLVFVAVLSVACACGTPESGTPASPTPVPSPSPAPAPSGPPATITVGAGEPFTSIQAALDAVAEGGTVTVRAGTYGERIVIRSRATLTGEGAIIDGLAGSERGIDAGMRIMADDVVVSGFVIRNWERGMVLDHSSRGRIEGNEIVRNYSKDPAPISAGVTKSDGIVLDQAGSNAIVNNYVHDNGSIGLYLRNGSSRNVVRGNRFVDNGWQQISAGRFGAGIYSAGLNSVENQIEDNEISGSDWGLRNGDPDGQNTILRNRIRNNRRAGLYIRSANNRIEGNAVAGNGLSNIAPTCRFDMVDAASGGGNAWVNNSGTFDRRTTSATACP